MNRIIKLISTGVLILCLVQNNQIYGQQKEEYIPKVIIEGKVGEKPGEFGMVNVVDSKGIHYRPVSLALNSKNEIYVLDHINNRIQKFNSEGKYLLSIPVNSCTDENGESVTKIKTFSTGNSIFVLEEEPVIVGKYIIIDKDDTLYYYLVNNKRGEIHLFKKDKFIKKIKIAKQYNAFERLVLDEEGNICLGELEEKEVIIQNKKNNFKTKIKIDKNNKTIKLLDEIGKVKKEVNIESDIKKDKELWISEHIYRNKNEKFYIQYGYDYDNYSKGEIYNCEPYVNEYNLDGILISRIRLPFFFTGGFNGPTASMDSEGNIYYITSPRESFIVQVKKLKRELLKK